MNRANQMKIRGANSADATTGAELLLELPDGPAPLGRRIEAALRAALRDGRLSPGRRLPPTRTLARDLGVSRRVVVEAYEQLTAEGRLEARQGSGTVVAALPGAPDAAPEPGAPVSAPARPAYDFFPGAPDLASFPRAVWLRALREVLAGAPDATLHYPDPAGTPELRRALAEHLARVRGVDAPAASIAVVSGARQGLALLARALATRGTRLVAVERPSLPEHVEVLRAAGVDVTGVRVDDAGLDVEALARSGASVMVATPAHQFPLGVPLAPERRAALLEWAAERPDRLVVEDDYDAEFRYDRRPVGALQALAPEHVAYLGSASKTLAPGLRLGWLVPPSWLLGEVVRQKRLDDAGTGVLEQLALARLLDSAAYDRHIRLARRRNRDRRDALSRALAAAVPGARLDGLAAGLHAIARLPAAVDHAAFQRAAAARGLGVVALTGPDGTTDALVLGYACLSEPAIEEGVRRLAQALQEAHHSA